MELNTLYKLNLFFISCFLNDDEAVFIRVSSISLNNSGDQNRPAELITEEKLIWSKPFVTASMETQFRRDLCDDDSCPLFPKQF